MLPKPPSAVAVVRFLLALVLAAGSARAVAQEEAPPFELVNLTATPRVIEGRACFELAAEREGECLALLNEVELADGSIEMELIGKPKPGAPPYAKGFLGLAFRMRGEGEARDYECVYLRPVNARVDDQVQRNHTVQYSSEPAYPWSRLRSEEPGRYESYVDVLPDAWNHMKVVVAGTEARLYVNRAAQPCLVVQGLKLGERSGRVAVWSHWTTQAYVRDVRVTPATKDKRVGVTGGTVLPREAMLADLETLRRTLHAVHPNLYLHRNEGEERSRFEALRARLERDLSEVEFYAIVAEYMTFFRDGHTFPAMDFAERAFRESLERGNTALPIELDFKDDALFVARSLDPQGAALRGATLVSLNGVGVERIIDQLQTYYCKAVSRLDSAHCRLFRPYHWLSFGPAREWTIEYDAGQGVESVTLPGLSRQGLDRARRDSGAAMERVPADYRFEWIDGGAVGLLTVDGMSDPASFRVFAERTFRTLEERGCRALVIDMRRNGGGSSAVGDELLSYLTSEPYAEGSMSVRISEPVVEWYRDERRSHPLFDFVVGGVPGELKTIEAPRTQPREVDFPFRGRCFLLTSGRTFSSGHMFAGLFRCNGIGPVVGQETGQATKTVGDMFPFTLPRTGLQAFCSYKIFEGPCDADFTRGFVPDHVVAYTAEERRAGVDKELALVRALLASDEDPAGG
ncbi:MAG: S41 family peptidase [Planctomycetota bacterium]